MSEARVRAWTEEHGGATPAAATGDGTIEGRVLDGEGRGLSGVTVRVDPRDELDRSADRSEPSTLDEVVRSAAEQHRVRLADRRETTTDASGSFRFDGLPERSWSLSAQREGYRVRPKGGGEVWTGARVLLHATRIVDVPVDVVDEAGASVARAVLELEGDVGAAALRPWTPEEAVVELPVGRHTIRAVAEDAATERCSEPREVVIARTGRPETLRFVLRARRGIRGRVLLPDDGLAPDRVTVVALRVLPGQELTEQQFMHAQQRESLRPGEPFAFLDLAPGAWCVAASREWSGPFDARETVEVGEGIERVDLALPAVDRARRVRIVALGPEGERLDGVGFRMLVERANSSWERGAETILDADGAYLVRVDPEHEEAYFGAPEGRRFTLTLRHADFGSTSIALEPGTTERTVRFGEPGRLEVEIVGYQEYFGRVRLGISHPNARLFQGVHYRGSNRISMDGVLTFGPLEPAQYRLVLSVHPAGSVHGGDHRNVAAAEVQVAAGDNRTVMRIPPLHTLRVSWPDGTPGAGVTLLTYGENDPLLRTHASAQLGEDGVLVFEDLPAGDYFLDAHSAGGMRVTVPGGAVEFAPREPLGLRVVIDDEEGDFARLGLRSGDVVVAVDGEPCGDRTAQELIGPLQAEKGASSEWLVERGDERFTVTVDGDLIGDWRTRGGRFMPELP